MARAFFLRMASAAGLLVLSFFLVGLIPFLSAAPSAGAAFLTRTTATVDRTFKSDRLPMPSKINSALTKNEPQRSHGAKKIPDGCDRSFSPISSPRLAYVYGRCTT